MQSNELWPLIGTVVMTVNSVPNHPFQLGYCFTLRKDVFPYGLCCIAAFRVFLNEKNKLFHITNLRLKTEFLWGVCAFVFMYLGLARKNRSYRVLSLALFALTLLKLFLYDIRGISEGGRIAAFITLGVLLLVISFMYQRIKRLLLVDSSDF